MIACRGTVLVTSLLLAALAGCRAPERAPAPQAHWTASRPGAGDLEAARGACTKEAAKATENIRYEGTASAVAIHEFLRCMEARGWQLERGAGEPTPPSQ